jgi:phosphomevalonate kinase
VIVRAPGKLLLTGAYAVLEGAPAIVLAVDRHAIADGATRGPALSSEVRAAFGEVPAPHVDARALADEAGHKLGLGSSAAMLVAALGIAGTDRGEDLREAGVRQRLFQTARSAHASAQSGGSGVDVAASIFGGTLRYSLSEDEPTIQAVDLPRGVSFTAFWTGSSARTSELRARVDALKARDPRRHAGCLAVLAEAAERAADAVERGDACGFVSASQESARGLDELGRAADAPVCTPAMVDLAKEAVNEDGAFLPSGAGGGDVAVYVNTGPPSQAFRAAAYAARMTVLPLGIDLLGVRAEDRVRTDH